MHRNPAEQNCTCLFFKFHDFVITFDDCTPYRLFIVQTVLCDASNVSNLHVPPRHYIKQMHFSFFFSSFSRLTQRTNNYSYNGWQ